MGEGGGGQRRKGYPVSEGTNMYMCDVLMSCSNIKNLVGSDSHAISTRGHRHIEFSVSLFSKPLKCK